METCAKPPRAKPCTRGAKPPPFFFVPKGEVAEFHRILLLPVLPAPLSSARMISAARLSSFRSSRQGFLATPRHLKSLSVSFPPDSLRTPARRHQLTPAAATSPRPTSRLASTRPRSLAPSCEPLLAVGRGLSSAGDSPKRSRSTDVASLRPFSQRYRPWNDQQC